jgi:hypothetical protein
MRLAALFWFYADFDVCENRLRLLRLFNPGLPIYGLYGGSAEDVEEARRRLGPLLDDFYAYGGAEPAAWKWRHGDRVIAALGAGARPVADVGHRGRGAVGPAGAATADGVVRAPAARTGAVLR